MNYTPKRSSDKYIQLNKKITNKEVIKLVAALSAEWLITEAEVCYRFINEYAAKEIKKRQEIQNLKR